MQCTLIKKCSHSYKIANMCALKVAAQTDEGPLLHFKSRKSDLQQPLHSVLSHAGYSDWCRRTKFM